jgi:ATP-binding cassette subfamily B protein
MASAAQVDQARTDDAAIIDRVETDLSDDGKWERRTLVLTAGLLEVLGVNGAILTHVPLPDIASVTVQESGGGAWMEVRLVQGGTRRIAFCTLSRRRALQAFNERLRECLRQKYPSSHDMKFTADQQFRLANEQETSSRLSWSERLNVLVSLAQYAVPYRKQMIVSGIVLLITIGLETVPPYLMKQIIDGGVLSSSISQFALLIGLLMTVYLLQAVFQVLRTSIGIRIGSLMMSHIRKDMFNKLMDLPIRYYERRKTAPFIGRIQYDSEWVQGFLTGGITHLLAQIVMSGAILALMFVLDWRLTFIMLALLPLCALAVAVVWPKLRSLMNRKWNSEYFLQQYISEAVQGIRVVKAFHREEAEKGRFAALNATAVKRMKSQQQWSQWLQPSVGLAISCGIALAWFVGGQQVIRGHMSLGTIIAFTTYLSMFLVQLRGNAQSMNLANSALASADRILDLLRTPIEVQDTLEPAALPHVRGEIAVHSLVFGYEQGRDVLKDISLNIRAGEKVGIVGHSGAGKTTLIHLICRFYDPDAGSITIDGVDLRRIAKADLRKHVGIVFQETYLFDGSIAQNILYGCPEATMEQMIQAARQANAHSFISSFPYGYDTLVGERGVLLSGGEKQRISIARTLLQNPSILILDEATSSVDLETEWEIQEALEQLSLGRTTLVIAHRLSTLQSSDRIIVLDQGRVAEIGSHNQLAQSNGIYSQLLNKQQMSPWIREEVR